MASYFASVSEWSKEFDSSSNLVRGMGSNPIGSTFSKNPMKRDERKYTERDVRTCLLTMLDQYNLDPENVDSAYAVAKEAKFLRMREVLKRAWKEGVLKHGTHEAKQAYINAWTFPAKGGAHAAEVGSQTYFTPTETKLFLAACNMCGRQGFYIAAAMLQDLMCDVLKSKTARAPRGTEWKEVITIDYVRKWIVKNEVQRYKNSGLDTKRAEKATEALRDAWFDLIRRCAPCCGLWAAATHTGARVALTADAPLRVSLRTASYSGWRMRRCCPKSSPSSRRGQRTASITWTRTRRTPSRSATAR